ncbi:MAG: hypothetical protein PHT12_02345, partial [Patescibacteria group bacterium]|nr:hypothetical protein [Patescibacteria group bacterium]
MGKWIVIGLLAWCAGWYVTNTDGYRHVTERMDRLHKAWPDPNHGVATKPPSATGVADAVNKSANKHAVPAGALYGYWTVVFKQNPSSLDLSAKRLKDAYRGDWTAAVTDSCGEMVGCVDKTLDGWNAW